MLEESVRNGKADGGNEEEGSLPTATKHRRRHSLGGARSLNLEQYKVRAVPKNEGIFKDVDNNNAGDDSAQSETKDWNKSIDLCRGPSLVESKIQDNPRIFNSALSRRHVRLQDQAIKMAADDIGAVMLQQDCTSNLDPILDESLKNLQLGARNDELGTMSDLITVIKHQHAALVDFIKEEVRPVHIEQQKIMKAVSRLSLKLDNARSSNPYA